MAQWIRHWFTKPKTLGLIPNGVVFLLHDPMDKALVYETKDSGFDPQWSRFSGCVIPAYLALDRFL